MTSKKGQREQRVREIEEKKEDRKIRNKYYSVLAALNDVQIEAKKLGLLDIAASAGDLYERAKEERDAEVTNDRT
jgi:hypothetical protein